MRLRKVMLVVVALLALATGLVSLWAGELETRAPRAQARGEFTHGSDRGAIPSRGEFEVPGEDHLGPSYIW